MTRPEDFMPLPKKRLARLFGSALRAAGYREADVGTLSAGMTCEGMSRSLSLFTQLGWTYVGADMSPKLPLRAGKVEASTPEELEFRLSVLQAGNGG